MCYPDKKSLTDIAKMICTIIPGKPDDILIENNKMGLSYCGDGTLLQNTFNFQYDGVFGGIKKTYEKI
jgi:hypothetical protein